MADKVYDFADGTIPPEFTHGGTGVVTAARVLADASGDGFTNAVELADIGDSGTAFLRLLNTIEFATGGGTVTFWRRIDSEGNFDFGNFKTAPSGTTTYTQHYDLSGQVAWAKVSFSLPAGKHDFEWGYRKDGSVSTGFDNHRIAGLTFTNVVGAGATGEPVTFTFVAVTTLNVNAVQDLPATLVLATSSGEAEALDRTGGAVTLTLLQDKVESPGLLPVSVGNGTPGAIAHFWVNGARVVEYLFDAEGTISVAQVPIAGLIAGSHVVSVSESATVEGGGLGAKNFTVVSAFDSAVVVVVGTEPPMPTQVDRWVFQAYDFSDVNSVDTWVLPLNPRQVTRPLAQVEIESEPTASSIGQVLSWEGAPMPAEWVISGNVLTEADYRELKRWLLTKQRFYMTDHFQRRYLVKVQTHRVDRVRDKDRPWHHTYEMRVAVLSGQGVRR